QSGNWTFQHTFSSTGDFRYFCTLHGSAGGFGMSGIVRVTGGGGGGNVPGNLRFAVNNVNVDEGNTATVTVQRVGGDDGAVSVSFATANGTAVAGDDYVATSGTLSWADNDDDPKTFQVQTIEDGAVESNETINLVLSNPGGGAGLGAPSTATVTIRDDDTTGTPGSLSFASASLVTGEGSGAVQLVVRRTGGSTGTVSARVMTHDGTATGGLDFTHVSQVVTFAAGDAANKTVTVPIVDDFDVEPTETFHAMLTEPSGGAALADPTMAAVDITDNEVDTGPCIEDTTTLCLSNDRFEVRASFDPPNDADDLLAPAQAIELTGDTGYFWFFDAANVEVVTKVLNACPVNQRIWVFAGGLTDVRVEIVVRDAATGAVNVYQNPQSTAFQPIQDTAAFATCP
ncbi:MAG TPA: Calx-beta domain-containing protein, partial [Thermoanaerobaculia bacterium]